MPVKRGVAANRSLPVDLFVLMQPRNGLARPQAGRISVSKFLGDFAQYGVIVRGLVARHSPPVHRLRCKMRIPIASDHIAVPSFRIGVFLLHKGDATELFDRYDFRALPIVDNDERLLGAVSARDVRSIKSRLG